MKRPVFWIEQLNIGTKRILLLFIVSSVLLFMLQKYTATSQLKFILLGSLFTIYLLLFYAMFLYGIFIRRHVFREHGQSYEIRDYCKLFDPLKNYRSLSRLHQTTTDSMIYISQQPTWAYFDSVRIAFNAHRLPHGASILILGGGGAAIAKTIRQTYPTFHVDVVDISQKMLSIARQYFLSPSDMKLIRLIRAEASQYVARTTHMYDGIIVDLFINSTLAPAVSSKNFIAGLARIQLPGGIIFLNFGHCPEAALPSTIYLYKKAFPDFRLHLVNKNIVGLITKKLIHLDVAIC